MMFLLINSLKYISTTNPSAQDYDYKFEPIDYDFDTKQSFMDTLIQDMKEGLKTENIIEEQITKIEKDIECKSKKLDAEKNNLEKDESVLNSSDLLKRKNEIEKSENIIRNLENSIKDKRSEQEKLQYDVERRILAKINAYLSSQ